MKPSEWRSEATKPHFIRVVVIGADLQHLQVVSVGGALFIYMNGGSISLMNIFLHIYARCDGRYFNPHRDKLCHDHFNLHAYSFSNRSERVNNYINHQWKEVNIINTLPDGTVIFTGTPPFRTQMFNTNVRNFIGPITILGSTMVLHELYFILFIKPPL